MSQAENVIEHGSRRACPEDDAGRDVQVPERLIDLEDLVLVTGAAGFIGISMVRTLLSNGFRRIRCFIRPSSDLAKLESAIEPYRDKAQIEILKGNLLSPEDCRKAAAHVKVVFHLAVGGGGRSFPDAFMNAVVITRNLIEATLASGCLRRFVNVSSFAVYTNKQKPHVRLLDESCPIEEQPQYRDAYCYAKVKQDELVIEYSRKAGLPYVILRPGAVYGPGKSAISGRVGIDTFGIFLHLGGGGTIPLTYVDNCAEAIMLAGVTPGVDGEIFNIIDDDLPSSRTFLKAIKREVRSFWSIYLPGFASYALCYFCEVFSSWSRGQLPPFLNRRIWHAQWKPTRYSNRKLKELLGWKPRVSTKEGLQRFFKSYRIAKENA